MAIIYLPASSSCICQAFLWASCFLLFDCYCVCVQSFLLHDDFMYVYLTNQIFNQWAVITFSFLLCCHFADCVQLKYSWSLAFEA
jgi:hypothetical protein